jgi:sigma-B regulation protein RsbU (phosphoserine phosphatase)
LNDFEFGARMLPARSVGGDFYDFILLDDDTAAISIGDVSDKGIPAAMFMALFCSLLRAEVQHIHEPAKILHRVNSHLLNLNEAGMFVTALLGLLDFKTRKFTYARAGHEVPILFNQDGGAKQINWDQGQLLGFFPDPKLDIQSIIIPPGNMLLLYTDGAFDARNPDGIHFGIDSLIETASLHVDQSPQTLCDQVIASLNKFQDSTPQYDDITLMAIKSSMCT